MLSPLGGDKKLRNGPRIAVSPARGSVLSRLQQLAERYYVAIVFAIFGVANADPWPFVLGFIAFGAAFDIWFAKVRAAAESDHLVGGQLANALPRRSGLIPFFLGYIVIGFLIHVVAIVLQANHPALLATLGPAVYDLASPFIALLRNHYQDLVAHGLLERANMVALIYAGLFLLFYSGLAFGLGKVTYTKVRNAPRGRAVSKGLDGGALRGAFLLLFLVLVIIYFTTWVNIDYSDRPHAHYRRRHFVDMNLNLAEYDAFFLALAVMQDLLVFALPFILWLARLMPRSALPRSD